MTQVIAFAVSVFIALGLMNAAMLFNTSHRVQIYMPPPPADGNPAGVSGGGPVGTGPITVPTPPPVTHGP